MSTSQDAIRRLSIQATTAGVTQAEAELRALAAAQGGVAVASAVTERATTSLDSKFASIERRYNTALRNQQDYAKLQMQVNAAVAQNPALQDRANAVLSAAADRYGQVTGAQKAFGIASQTVNLQVAALASGLGITGQLLSAFGPWGFAAAVGIGAVQSALSLASDKAHELAQKAKEISEFSEATGLTTRQFQALRSEAGKFGIDSESMATAISKFTAGFESLRLGTGDLLTQVRRINPALAEQMQQATDTATAFTLFGRAVAATDNIFQRNALLKAGMGRGATTFGAFFESAPDVGSLTAAFDAANKGIDAGLIPKLKQLEIDINKTKSAANTVFASMFGTGTLEGELQFQKGLLTIATTLASIKMSDDMRKFLDLATSPTFLTVLAVLAGAGAIATAPVSLPLAGALAVGGAVAGAGAVVGGISAAGNRSPAASAATAQPKMVDFVSPSNSYSKFQAPAPELTDQAKLANMQQQIALLGSAATATEKYNAALADLKLKGKDAALGEDLMKRAIGGLDLDTATARQSAHNTALGASTPIADLVIAKGQQLQKLQRDGANLSESQIKFQKDITASQALGTFQIDAAAAAEQVHATALGMTAEQGISYSIVQTKINEGIALHNELSPEQIAKLQKSADAYAKVKVAGDRYEDTMRSVNQATTQFGDNLAQGLAKGDDAMQTLISGLGTLGSSLSSIGTKSIGDSLTTALKGGGLSFDPVSLGIGAAGVGISLISNIIGGNEKQRQELEAAQDAWKKAGPAFQKFLTEMTGGVQGDLAAMFQQNFQTAYDLAVQADKAGDRAAVTRIYEAEATNARDAARKFLTTFNAALQGMTDGLGQNSPFLGAVNNVKTQLTTVQKFVDDSRVAIETALDVADLTTGQLRPGTLRPEQTAIINDTVGKATAAAQAYLLTMLQQAPVLSTVNTALLNLNGTAASLQDALVQLGMSSGDAAAAIRDGVSKALDAIKTQFQDSLTERLNTANGQGYLNDAVALIKQHAQDLADAASLGLDSSLANSVFHAEAQKIVNDAGLVGDAFADFTKQFPDLAGVVTQASADVAAAVKQQQDALNASAKSIVDYVNGLTTGAQSTLSPGDKLNAAQSVYNATLAMAQTGNADAQGRISTDAEALRSAARDMYGSTIGYQSVLDSIKTQLLSLPAVQQTTDPVVQAMRDVLLAVQATTGAVVAMQGALIGGLAANSPSAIAGAFLSSGAAGLTFDQFKAGFPPGLATDDTLHGLYSVIDTNKNGIISQLELLQATLKPAIDSGNAASIASALSTYFNVIASNTDAGISLPDMQVALAGMASNGALRDMFTRLDTDNSGSISRLELISAASQSTSTSALNTWSQTAQANSLLENSNAIANYANQIGNAQIGIQNNQVALLSAIQGLQSTSSSQLALLNQQYAAQPFTASVGGGNATINNTMVQALNKIVFNTYAIAANTAGGNHVTGYLATGGWITGGTPGVDSVPLNGGRTLGMPGEFVVARDVAQANRDWLPDFNAGRGIPVPTIAAASFRGGNDNGDTRALLAELRELRKELAEIKGNTGRGAQASAIAAGTIAEVRDAVAGGNSLQSDNNKMLRRVVTK